MNKYNDALLYKILRPVISFLFKILYQPKIIGADNIPDKGRIILAGNHTNNLDCVLLMSSTKRNIHFLAKIELFKGIKKIIFSNMGLIPVNRKIKNPQVYEEANKYLNNEKVIGIFPEGTFGKGKILPFKIGAVKIANDTQSKIVPFSITGEYKLFSKNLVLKYGKPLNIDNNLEEENERLRNIIIEMVGDKN